MSEVDYRSLLVRYMANVIHRYEGDARLCADLWTPEEMSEMRIIENEAYEMELPAPPRGDFW